MTEPDYMFRLLQAIRGGIKYTEGEPMGTIEEAAAALKPKATDLREVLKQWANDYGYDEEEFEGDLDGLFVCLDDNGWKIVRKGPHDDTPVAATPDRIRQALGEIVNEKLSWAEDDEEGFDIVDAQLEELDNAGWALTKKTYVPTGLEQAVAQLQQINAPAPTALPEEHLEAKAYAKGFADARFLDEPGMAEYTKGQKWVQNR